ncbi:hypothetical protein ABIE67_005735 [Streptomyces sp. V4I8]
MAVGKVGTRTVPPRESGNRYPHPAAAHVPPLPDRAAAPFCRSE